MARYTISGLLAGVILLGYSAEAWTQNPDWTLHEVASGAAKPALALTPDGVPHIAYMLEANAGYVHHAVWNDDTETFLTAPVVNGYFYGPLAIAVDRDGNSHINYHDHTTADQQHVFQVGQGWENEPIRSAGHDEVGLGHLLCYELSDRDGPERLQHGLAESRYDLWVGKQLLLFEMKSQTVLLDGSGSLTSSDKRHVVANVGK